MIEAAFGRIVPTPARVLGYAGLLPPLACIGTELIAGRMPGLNLVAFLGQACAYLYAAVILSFLGGSWWGMAVRAPHPAWLAVAVLPSLIAVAALGAVVLPGKSGDVAAATILCAGLLLALVVDHRLVRAGLAPRWWMRLRVPLSIGLAAETIVATLLA